MQDSQKPADMNEPMGRKVVFTEGAGETEVTREGVFLGFGVDYEELRDGVGQYSTAIVEARDGTVHTVMAGSITFEPTDRGDQTTPPVSGSVTRHGAIMKVHGVNFRLGVSPCGDVSLYVNGTYVKRWDGLDLRKLNDAENVE